MYLAKHRDLEEYRAIKQVPKTCAEYAQFRKEALILKEIRHPGIPIVYDLEEDEQYSYLIEEFLEGDSMYALVSDMGHFSKAMAVRYGIQICHLVSILHSARPNPILYLDLQPKNLLICHDTVKLIDFDHAVHRQDVKDLTKRYGTVGCAAPEQYTGDILDERTDIYAIGAVLHYMLTGEYPGEGTVRLAGCAGWQLARVIRICLSGDPMKRYGSAEELCRALQELSEGNRLTREWTAGGWKWCNKKGRKQGNTGENQISSLAIAVAGSRPGAGATHIAIGLTAYLREYGVPAMYVDCDDSGTVRQLALWAGAQVDRYGLYRIRGVPMLPFYGESVQMDKPPYPVSVRDYGTDKKKLLTELADGYVLVCEAKPWERESSKKAIQSLGNLPGLTVIYNHFCRRLCSWLPGPAKGTDCFLMPFDPDPFACPRPARKVYKAVFRTLAGDKTGGILRDLPERVSGSVSRMIRGIGGPWE